MFSEFANKEVLIAGGLGFIGSNLAIKLVQADAKVTLLDAILTGRRRNLFNIEPIKNDVILNFSDNRDEHSVNYIVREKDHIFHLAGQNDHVLSLTDRFADIDINITGLGALLEACKKFNDALQPTLEVGNER